jgi:putative transposase
VARPLRIEFPGALYHVTSRGNARQSVFLSDEDRRRFLELLGMVVDRFHWNCHAYCLMDNHYHLMIETPEGNLSRGMRQLNGIYTQKFNWSHQRTGHVFQGRFKAILVEKDSYLLELSRYVVLNPVRAKIVENPEDWPWSSFCATIGRASPPSWLSTEWLLGCFSRRKIQAQKLFHAFALAGKSRESPWKELRGQIFMGDRDFLTEKLKVGFPDDIPLAEVPRAQRMAPQPSLAELFSHQAAMKTTDRDERIYDARVTYGYRLREIGDFLGLHYATVSKIVARVSKEKWQYKT